MKKFMVCVLAIVTMAFTANCFVGCTPREEILRIYNWGEYMDPGVISGFSDWYMAKTQKKIKVKYSLFSVNESMYTQIETNKIDYDLVCPSDYMAERMIRNGLAEEIDKTIVDVSALVRSDLLEKTKAYDPESKYTVPYMWGTLGIMYDVTKVTEAEAEKMTSWDAMFDNGFNGRMLMKDSIRDAYVLANLYNNRTELRSLSNYYNNYNNSGYRTLLDDIFMNTEQATIDAVEATLKSQYPLVLKYEVDDGKEDMLKQNTDASLGLFWSCDSGFVMNDQVLEATGCSAEKLIRGNKDLRYVVPYEGSNVWVDCWLIPKYAENKPAANYFLQYLCEEAQAKANMAYIGSSTPIESLMVSYQQELLESDFFDGTAEGFKEMYMDMMFPSPETLERCAIMRDFGTKDKVITDMWMRVKAG